jgi:hypothetical protein
VLCSTKPESRFRSNPLYLDALNESGLGYRLQNIMKLNVRKFVGSLWSRPDPVLAGAGVAGELLVAKIRLFLATVLLLIPVINSLFFPVDPKEAIVGMSLASGTFFLSVLVYYLISARIQPGVAEFCKQQF